MFPTAVNCKRRNVYNMVIICIWEGSRGGSRISPRGWQLKITYPTAKWCIIFSVLWYSSKCAYVSDCKITHRCDSTFICLCKPYLHHCNVQDFNIWWICYSPCESQAKVHDIDVQTNIKIVSLIHIKFSPLGPSSHFWYWKTVFDFIVQGFCHRLQLW